MKAGPRRGRPRLTRRTGLGALLALGALVLALCACAGGAAAAEGCEWQPHKVRVVKHVRRHGKRVKVVHQRVRWSCVAPPPAPVAAPSAPVVAPPPAPVPTPPVTPPTPPAEESGDAHYVGARAYEYGFEPTGPSFEVHAGEDTIELVNGGEDAHNLDVERVGRAGNVLELGAAEPGETKKGKVTLEAGEYRLYCSFKGHAMKGMERTLVVTP